MLREIGFTHVQDYGAEMINARYFHSRADGLKLAGRGHLMKANV